MNGRPLSLALLLAAALFAMPASAQLYKWTDANGRVQYSDKPPTGQKAQTLTRSSISTVPGSGGTAGDGGAAPKSTAEQEQEFRKRRAEQEEAQKKAQKVAEEQSSKQANCLQAQRQLAGLQAGGRVATFDEKGERRFLDDADVQQEIAKSQAAVARWCR